MAQISPIIKQIKEFAENDSIAFKKHSAIRMRQRNISANEVKEILIGGQVIEDYPDDIPLPTCLILGFTKKQKPIHAVVAVDESDRMLYVITVYSPNNEEWENGFKKRRETHEMPIM
jgi:hypothetical protein